MIEVAEIRPAPTDDEREAIIAALEAAWPKPAKAASEPSAWRLSGRPWIGGRRWPPEAF